jgi:probable F420-dependent oxidoreductase
MRIGLVLPHGGRVVEQKGVLRDFAQAAEELGFDSLWAGDHLAVPAQGETPYPWATTGDYPVPADRKFLEPFTTLSYVAAVTDRITLGISVCILPYRRPLELAKMAGSLDYLCGGRLILGAGTGWMREEFDAIGVPFESRGSISNEILSFLQVCQDADGPVSFHGSSFDVREMYIEPRRHDEHRIPIWIGGRGDAAARRAVRFGDAWHPPLFGAEPGALADRYLQVREQAAALGKPAPALTLFLMYQNLPVVQEGVPWGQGYVAGPASSLIEVLERYSAIGVEHFVMTIGGGLGTRIRVMEEIAVSLQPKSEVTSPAP